MRLSTMTLPTGEFVFVLSEAAGAAQAYHNGLRSFTEHIGAAAIFVTDQVVEIDNALVDERARRTDAKPAEMPLRDWERELVGDPVLADLETGELEEVADFKVGDRVRMSGVSHFGNDCTGMVGKVEGFCPAGDVKVVLDDRAPNGSRVVHYNLEQLEVISDGE